MDTNFTTMVVDFENLLGGGDLGDTLNLIMTNLGTSVFNQVSSKRININQFSNFLFFFFAGGFCHLALFH